MAMPRIEDDELLIECVAKHPVIYDAGLPQYRDSFIRQKIWKQIGDSVKRPADECKKRWKNLRDSFFRFKRKSKLATGSAAEGKVSKWPLYDRLTFLDNVVGERESLCNVQLCNEESVDCTTIVEPIITLNSNSTDNSMTEHFGTSECYNSNPSPNVVEHRPQSDHRRKRKHNSQEELLHMFKIREERRQSEREQYLTSQELSGPSSNYRNPVNSFGEHVKAVLHSLPHNLMLSAKTEIFAVLTKYETEHAEQMLQQCDYENRRTVYHTERTNRNANTDYVSEPSTSRNARTEDPPEEEEELISCENDYL